MDQNKTLRVGLIAALILFLIGFAAGAFFWDRYEAAGQRSALVDALNKAPIITTVQGATETKTEIAYVPKEIIKYIDASGQEVAAPEKTDLDVRIAKPDFIVNVNGQQQTFARADNENYLFDKNKILFDQSSKIIITVDDSAMIAALAKAQQKHFSAGVDRIGSSTTAGVGYSPNNTIDYKIHKEIAGDKIGAGLWIRF